MTELHFIVERAAEGGYLARAVGTDIFTEADDLPTLRAQVQDAVYCHFGGRDRLTIELLYSPADGSNPFLN